MLSFLEETIESIQKSYSDLSQLTLILPSKRAGGFLKNYLLKKLPKTTFSPKILSIEEFIEELSDLKIIDRTELLFKSYQAYIESMGDSEKDSFETFSTWANTLLGDFSEIDRYLIDTDAFFNYLNSIKTMNRWNVENEQSELIENYLEFWNKLPILYQKLNEILSAQGVGYQGMVYRKAAEDIEHYIAHNSDKIHLFIGFNALNNSEQSIIQTLLESGNTEIYWDIENHFLENTNHGVSLFIREYLSSWKHYKTNSPLFLSDYYVESKSFQSIAVQKNIGQAKYLGNILLGYSEAQLSNTAIVLADETLLSPVLYSLPENVKQVNVTMGLSLKDFSAALFFDSLLYLQKLQSSQYYYKPILDLLHHPLILKWVPDAKEIANVLVSENITYLSIETLLKIASEDSAASLKLLFSPWDSTQTALHNCLALLLKLKNLKNSFSIDRVVWHEIYQIFIEIKALDGKYNSLQSIDTIHQLFGELITTSTLDFGGDAYNGIQIMGVLETRCLDFENIILLSVNEGVLPSGKSNASFITYDLKKQFGLPLYTEKDAIYTYHFYKMLFRAKQVTLLYNNHSEGLTSGEKSRFILQLENEKLPQHTLEHITATLGVKVETRPLKSVEKSEAILERLREIASKGFSPSALTSYIRNPMDFYYKKILKIKEYDEVEETVAYNTLGTIVHDALQNFYEPFVGEELTSEKLKKCFELIDQEVTLQFKKSFKEGEFSKGKNLIIFEVAKRYIQNLINLDLSELKKGNIIKIIAIENDLRTPLTNSQFDFPVYLTGKVDRIDSLNDQVRIIDYKTGSVSSSDLSVKDWPIITNDYKYSKAFQVLTYSYMWKDNLSTHALEAGIISFKNLSSGFMKFTDKTDGSRSGNAKIDKQTIDNFEPVLHSLITELFDPSVPFTEKEI